MGVWIRPDSDKETFTYDINTVEGLYPECEIVIPLKYGNLHKMLLDEPSFIHVICGGAESYIRMSNIDSIHKTPVILKVIEGTE